MFSGITDWFKNIFSTIKELFSTIFSVIQDVIGGIMKMVSSLIGSLFKGIGGMFGGLFHGGGISHSPSVYRFAPMSAFAGAPRFASGFYPGEYPAILHKNEAVIPLTGGRYIPVKFNSDQKQQQPVNITIYTRDPETKIKYKPSRSQQRAALITMSKRGIGDV